MALSDDALYRRLVRIGVMPSIAERIIAKAKAANGELPTEIEAAQDAIITDGDKELAAQWWLYTPDVPRKYKRVLHATPRR